MWIMRVTVSKVVLRRTPVGGSNKLGESHPHK